MTDPNSTISRRSLEVLVPFFGLIYSAIVLSYTAIGFFSRGAVPSFVYIFFVFIAVFLIGAVGVWRLSRVGYIIAAAASAAFLLLDGPQVAPLLSEPTLGGGEAFFDAVTLLPVIIASLVYSASGLRRVWHKGAPLRVTRMIPASSALVLMIVGFIVGGMFIGLLAAATETRMLASSSAGGDITIVQGAASPKNAQFYVPASYTVKAGTTFTWVNKDGAAHTSVGSNLFDSGNVDAGGTYKFTFTQPGTYQYYCTLHPWMKGTIIVAAS